MRGRFPNAPQSGQDHHVYDNTRLASSVIDIRVAAHIHVGAGGAPGERPKPALLPRDQLLYRRVIRTYWERNGGLAVFGYPISDPVYLRDRAHAVGSSGSLRHCARRPARNLLAGRVLAQLSPGTTPSSRT
jgi:hypothetical protein